MYTLGKGPGKSADSHREHEVRHAGANQPLIPIQARQGRKVAPLTQRICCYKGGCALVAESSKGASKEAKKQLLGSWASRGSS